MNELQTIMIFNFCVCVEASKVNFRPGTCDRREETFKDYNQQLTCTD